MLTKESTIAPMPLNIPRIKALCFDVDGTLSDTDDLYARKVVPYLPRAMFPDPDQLGVDLIIPDFSFVESRREHRLVYYRVADKRVSRIVDLADELLEENEEHVAACRTIAE